MSVSNIANTSPTTTQPWFHLVPVTNYIDSGYFLNQTGLNIYTEATEIDDGGFLQVTFNDTQDASPFYIDASTGRLLGDQSYWGLESMYSWHGDFQGSVWSWNSDGTPDVNEYYYPTFEVDGQGYLQAKGAELKWGWCPDEEGVGNSDPYLPGTVFLTGDTSAVEALKCVVFDGLKAVATDPPSKRR